MVRRGIVCFLLPALVMGCTHETFVPVNVTVKNLDTGQPQPGVRVGVIYNGGEPSQTPDTWVTTDATGQAVVSASPNNDGGTFTTRRGHEHDDGAIPELVIANDELEMVDQGESTETFPLDLHRMHEVQVLKATTRPYHVTLHVKAYGGPHIPSESVPADGK
jgi:hypothetical protein